MKKILVLLVLSFAFGLVKAQVQVPYMSVNTSQEGYAYLGVPVNYTPYDITYTPSTSSGEFSHISVNGTTMDVTWSISGSTLSWESTVTAPDGIDLHLHRFYIYDDTSADPQTFTDDDFEDGDFQGFGSNYWHSSGSADLGNIQRDISFSYENDDFDAFTSLYGNEVIFGTIHYLQP